MLTVCVASLLLSQVTATDSDPLLLETLIINNKTAQERYSNFTVVQTWDTIEPYLGLPREGLPAEDILCHYEMTLTREHDHYLLFRTESISSRSGSWGEERVVQCVSNDDYSAIYYEKPTNTAYLHRHGQGLERSEAGVHWMAEPCALDYLFGYGSLIMHKDYERSKDRSHWSVDRTEHNGESLYRITRQSPSKNGYSRRVCYYLNPDKDFLLQGIQAYDREGKLSEETSVEFAEAQVDGLWTPKTIKVKEYSGACIELTMHVEQFLSSPALNPDIFSYRSFAAAEGTVITMNLDSETGVEYKYVSGEWKPLIEEELK